MESPFKSKSGLSRLLNATKYALAGLKAAYMHEAAIRQEVALMVVLVPLGLYLGADAVEKVLLVGVVVQVLIVELLNSAVEAAVDHTSLAKHELAARAKDIGGAAVFVSLLLVALVWGLILFL
jgi:diacylglycerol kinase (ATP)